MRTSMMICAALVAAACSTSAQAYRPFDGTDASVAEPGLFELELGTFGYVRQGAARSVVAPAVVGNIGFEGDTELVLEGRVNRLMGDIDAGYRTSLGDTALSLKHVLRKGSLQDGGSGVSIAAECGVLLKEVHGLTGTGASCAGIASQRFDAAAVHLNLALTRTREHTEARLLDMIVEGQGESPVRPVMELFVERDNAGAHTASALVGMIWKHSEELSFDAGLRRARSDGEKLTELRVGLTWSYAMHK